MSQEKNAIIGDIYTGSGWLFVFEAFTIGKVKLLMGSNKDKSIKVLAYADIKRIRPLLYDLFARGGLSDQLWPNRKFEVFGGGEYDGSIQSRVVIVQDSPSMQSPIIITVENGAGKKNKTGAIQPEDRKNSDKASVFLTRLDARVLAGEILSHIDRFLLTGAIPEAPDSQTPVEIVATNTDETYMYGAPEIEETFDTQPNDYASGDVTITTEEAKDLWRIARNHGFSDHGFGRFFQVGRVAGEPISYDRSTDLPKRLFEGAKKALANTAAIPFFNLDGLLATVDLEEMPDATTMQRFHAVGNQLCRAKNLNWDEVRPKFVSLTTAARRHMGLPPETSASDLCAREMDEMIAVMNLEIRNGRNI